MLKKSEIEQISKLITDIPRDLMMQHVGNSLKEQLNCKDDLPEILDALLRDTSLLQSIIEYHQTTFVTLYKKFCKGKEKYLHFQVKWYRCCFLCQVLSVTPTSTQMKYVMLNSHGRNSVTNIHWS